MAMTHGLMFHYFDNEEIPRTQGSIGANQFGQIIDRYAADHNLLPAEEYMEKALRDNLHSEDVCLTFDDGLYSQYAIANKILEKKGLTAFYFVYTSPMEGILEKTEVYRAFRNRYEAIDDFYSEFFYILIEYGKEKGVDYKSIMETEEARQYFLQYDYYTKNDRLFRYLRNEILKEKYDFLMEQLMKKNHFNPVKECKDIWITQEQLSEMDSNGNVIGLHSHTHFTSLKGMNYNQKKWEYSVNKAFLEKIVQTRIRTASYPCDTFDLDSDKILTSLGVDIAFIAHYEEQESLLLHRIPRIDASAILKTL